MTNSLRDLPAWGISLAINMGMLLSLHFVVQTVERATSNQVITTSLDERLVDDEYQFQEVSTSDTVGSMGESGAFTASASVAQSAAPTSKVSTETKARNLLGSTQVNMVNLPDFKQASDGSTLGERVEVRGTGDSVQGGVNGVMDRLTLEIRRSLEDNQTMVVWLFDASGSLNERRAAMAERFGTVYQQLEKLQATDGLHTVVASYGQSAALLTPTPVAGNDLKELTEAVKNIKVDDSGKENVFTALNLCIDKFKSFTPKNRRTNRIVFIVTDERGDDFQLLEETINKAKQFHFRIFCVGNGAVFGQEKGYVRHRFEDGYEIDIPVDQGPETAYPMAMQLPFWGSQGDWKLRLMSAGYGPYTLTRLCAETGGMYLMSEQARGYQFDPAAMKEYVPDYRPIRVIQSEIQKNPAMAALVQAAGYTYQSRDGIPTPESEFLAFTDTILRAALTEAQKPAAEMAYPLEQLNRILEAGAKGRDTLRDPRWRASFDLAIGRVLAMRVRLEGYNRMLANMKANPLSFKNPASNQWAIVPAAEIDTGPQMRKAAEQARMYLKRVIDEHPGTPFALMAEKELSQDLGWKWEEKSVPLPPGAENQPREEQARLLLAEEERQRTEQMRNRAKPRNVPKL